MKNLSATDSQDSIVKVHQEIELRDHALSKMNVMFIMLAVASTYNLVYSVTLFIAADPLTC